jgi:hypothetical protein
VQTTQQRTLTPLEAQQYPNAVKNGQTYTLNETTTSTEYAPIQAQQMAPWPAKTAACKVGVLPIVIAPPKRDDELTNLLGDEGGIIPDGLRMAGTYSGQGGASIEFLSDKAILGCNATLVERPYTVAIRPGQVLINLAGGSGAKTFSLKPDGTLAGDNTPIFLNGRRKTGVNALGETTYSASSGTCGYGLLSPRGKP